MSSRFELLRVNAFSVSTVIPQHVRTQAMVVIGVTGGIASGKTLVTHELARLGAVVLDADRAGHAVLRMREVKAALRQRWGDAVFDPRGQIVRSAVARRVFAPPPEGPRELEFLERVTHPRIETAIRRRLERLSQHGGGLVAVLDAPVLFKAGWDAQCDLIVFVEAAWEVRAARARARGWSEGELEAREAAQSPLEFKRSRADVVIDNSRTRAETVAQVEKFWQSIKKD